MFNVYVCNLMVMTDTYVCTYDGGCGLGGGVERKRGVGWSKAYEEQVSKTKKENRLFLIFFIKNLREGGEREFNKLPPPNRPTHPNKGGGGVGQFHFSYSALNNLNTPAPPPPPRPKREVLILP